MLIGDMAVTVLAARGVDGVLHLLREYDAGRLGHDHFAVMCATFVKMTRVQQLAAYDRNAVGLIFRHVFFGKLNEAPNFVKAGAIAALCHTWGQFNHPPGPAHYLTITVDDMVSSVMAMVGDAATAGVQPLAHFMRLVFTRGEGVAMATCAARVVEYINAALHERYDESDVVHFAINALAVIATKTRGRARVARLRDAMVACAEWIEERGMAVECLRTGEGRRDAMRHVKIYPYMLGKEWTALEWVTYAILLPCETGGLWAKRVVLVA